MKAVKMRFIILALFVFIALSSTVAFSSTTAAASIQDFLSSASTSTANLFGFAQSNPSPARQGQTANNSASSSWLSSSAPAVDESIPAEDAATITTDKTDYQPGETVVITGTGWMPNETVSIAINMDDPQQPVRNLDVTADDNGNVFNLDFAPSEDHLGKAFTMSANGYNSQKTATGHFTDGVFSYTPNTASISIKSGQGPIKAFTQSVKSEKETGNCGTTSNPDCITNTTVSMKVVGGTIPASWLSASPNSLTLTTNKSNNAGSDTKAWDIYVSVPPNTNAGNYSSQIYAAENGTALGSQGTTLTVMVTNAATPNTTASAVKADSTVYNIGNYTNQNITVTLTPQNMGDGVASTEYYFNTNGVSGATTTHNGSTTFSLPTISTPGITVVSFRSKDNLGNNEVWKNVTVKIDKTSPVLTLPEGINAGDTIIKTIADNSDGLYYDFKATATDIIPPSTSPVNLTGVTCNPPSGSFFQTTNPTTVNCSVTDAAGNTTTAFFKVKVIKTNPNQTLTVTKAGAGSGTVTSEPAGINCGNTCSSSFNQGTNVTLTATAAAGSEFSGWSGGGATNSNGTRSVNLDIDRSVTATFKAIPTITWNNPADITYGTALSTTQLNATASVSGTFSYTQAAGTILNAGSNQTLTVNFTPNDASNYTTASKTVSINVAKASSTTAITCPTSVTYNGSAQTPCSVSVTGVNSLNQTPSANYSNNTNAGLATASYNFAGDANYASSSDSKNFTIAKAAVTATAGNGTATYDGSTKSPSDCAVTGAYKGNLACTNNPASVGPNVGTTTIKPVISGDGQSNFDITLVEGSATINKAGATITLSNLNPTYDGSAQQATATTNPNGLSGVSISYSQNSVPVANPTNAGSYAIVATLTNGNYKLTDALGADINQVTGTLVIGKAGSSVTVTCPTMAQTYTGVAQTPCTAKAAGAGMQDITLTVGYASNTNVGNATASVNWGGDANHNGSEGNSGFEIAKAGSTTVVSCPSTAKTYTGSPIEPCTAKATGAGMADVSLTVGYSNNVNVGSATANANWDGDANHNESAGDSGFSIEKAGSTVTVTCPNSALVYNGSAQNPVCTASVTGAGGLNQSLQVSYSNNTNAGTATASASYAGDANHTGSSDSKTFTIAKAGSTVTVNCPTNGIVYDPTIAMTPCTASVTGAGGLNQSLTVSYLNNRNAGTATASASYAGDANHTGNSGIAYFAIAPRAMLVNYIGQTQFVTSGTSSTTAQVTLSASMQDPTGLTLIGAKVDFIDMLTSKVLASGVPVSQVANSPANTGTANTIVTLSTGQYGSNSYKILVKVAGSYTNENQAISEKTANVFVSQPSAANTTKANGTFEVLGTAAGTYRSLVGVPSFDIGMAYNSSGTNLQGNVRAVIPQADGSTVFIKSNSISSMAVSNVPGGKKSTIYTKASVYKVSVDGMTTTSIGGNVSLRADIIDAGTTKQVGFTALSSSTSELFYSNNWQNASGTWQTVLQAIKSGTLSIN